MVESSVHDRLFCWHQHSGSVHGYSEIRSRSKLSVHCCTNFGFIRFVWPCLDDSDICDLLWRIKCSRNFRPPLWILPRVVQITAYELKSQSTGNKCHSMVLYQDEISEQAFDKLSSGRRYWLFSPLQALHSGTESWRSSFRCHLFISIVFF